MALFAYSWIISFLTLVEGTGCYFVRCPGINRYIYNRKLNKATVLEKIPFFALSVLFGLVRSGHKRM